MEGVPISSGSVNMSDSLEINKKTSSGLGVCILFSVVSVLLVAADQIIMEIGEYIFLLPSLCGKYRKRILAFC